VKRNTVGYRKAHSSESSLLGLRLLDKKGEEVKEIKEESSDGEDKGGEGEAHS